MRTAIVSDLHSNVPAWNAVIRDLTEIDADQPVARCWALGDWLGYGSAHPLHIWDCLRFASLSCIKDLHRDPASHCVIGNHDIGVLDGCDAVEGCQFNAAAFVVIQKQRHEVSGSSGWSIGFKPWLRQHSLMLSPHRGVFMTHGAFDIHNPAMMPCLYTTRDMAHRQQLRGLIGWLADPVDRTLPGSFVASEGWEQPLLLLTGHTHEQAVWQRNAESNGAKIWPQAPGAGISRDEIVAAIASGQPLDHTVILNVTPEEPVWLNPGSVGLQRDRTTPRPWQDGEWARYSLLDWDHLPGTLTIHLRWVPYILDRN